MWILTQKNSKQLQSASRCINTSTKYVQKQGQKGKRESRKIFICFRNTLEMELVAATTLKSSPEKQLNLSVI